MLVFLFTLADKLMAFLLWGILKDKAPENPVHFQSGIAVVIPLQGKMKLNSNVTNYVPDAQIKPFAL